MSTPEPEKEMPHEHINNSQLGWFAGHVLTVLNVFLYTFSYYKRFSYGYSVYYCAALIGVVVSFGILNFQLFQKEAKLALVLKDDNFQYFALGLALLLHPPYVWLTLVPFSLFSFFHVLVSVNTYVLPRIKYNTSAISSKISAFVTNNNTKSIQLASVVEIYTYLWLLLRLLVFRKRSLIPFIVYSVFIKARFESSIFTRNYFKTIELNVEDTVNSYAGAYPLLKQVWVSFKGVLAKIGGFYLVRDYTKEKNN